MASRRHSPVLDTGRPADLPDFERPPLVEVVLGVQFAELHAYRTVHAGLLWNSAFRDQFPTCTERPPIDAAFETFGGVRSRAPAIEFSAVPGPLVRRLWFVNRDETELIQVQADRFLHNWRKGTYPRYEPIRQKFFEELERLKAFFQSEGIGSIEPNQCEVTYVNHLQIAEGIDPRSQLHRFFRFWRPFESFGTASGARLPEFEEALFTARFVITRPGTSDPVGRLHITAEPAVERDDKPILRVNLTARGVPASPTFEGVADFLNLGRETIVRGFTSITSDEMHETWGRTK